MSLDKNVHSSLLLTGGSKFLEHESRHNWSITFLFSSPPAPPYPAPSFTTATSRHTCVLAHVPLSFLTQQWPLSSE